ncbi:hypothetical protein J6590_038911 [Homalodisca vitripennis]|nr:hypothetical protein J6590_038911 [Homalodisca vitripennis]
MKESALTGKESKRRMLFKRKDQNKIGIPDLKFNDDTVTRLKLPQILTPESLAVLTPSVGTTSDRPHNRNHGTTGNSGGSSGQFVAQWENWHKQPFQGRSYRQDTGGHRASKEFGTEGSFVDPQNQKQPRGPKSAATALNRNRHISIDPRFWRP